MNTDDPFGPRRAMTRAEWDYEKRLARVEIRALYPDKPECHEWKIRARYGRIMEQNLPLARRQWQRMHAVWKLDVVYACRGIMKRGRMTPRDFKGLAKAYLKPASPSMRPEPLP